MKQEEVSAHITFITVTCSTPQSNINYFAGIGTEEPILSQDIPSQVEEDIEIEVKKTDEEIAAAKRAKSKKKQVGCI